MIFIIISNIGLALMTLLVYMRYSHFRVTYGNKIKELQRNLKIEKSSKTEIESKLGGDFKKENEQVKSLLRELESVRKERQDEVKLRMEAEKEIELSKEKIVQVQKRVDDWKKLQESAITDSKELIMSFGQELVDMVNKTHKEEESRTREFFEQNVKSIESNVNTLHKEIGGIDNRISDFRKKVSQVISSSQKRQAAANAAPPSTGQKPAVAVKEQDKTPKAAENEVKVPPKKSKLDKVAQKALEDVVSLAQASGLEHMKDYIISDKLEGEVAQYMLCDLFLVINGVGHFVDFKADRFFVEYGQKVKESGEEDAVKMLKMKLDKYLSYISNPKYDSLNKKLLSVLKIEVGESKIVCALKAYDDLRLVGKIGYSKKVEELDIVLMDVNGVNDLIL